MKHLHALSRTLAPRTASASTVETLISFLIAILTAIEPLISVLGGKNTTT